MPVTHTEMNQNCGWQLAGSSPGPCRGSTVCSLCFLLVLIGFLCWLRADRDVVVASISGRLKKQDQYVVHFTNEKLEKENKVAHWFLLWEPRPTSLQSGCACGEDGPSVQGGVRAELLILRPMGISVFIPAKWAEPACGRAKAAGGQGW